MQDYSLNKDEDYLLPAAIGGGNTQAADWDRAKARSLVGGV